MRKFIIHLEDKDDQMQRYSGCEWTLFFGHDLYDYKVYGIFDIGWSTHQGDYQ